MEPYAILPVATSAFAAAVAGYLMAFWWMMISRRNIVGYVGGGLLGFVLAVTCAWNLFSFDPAKKAKGENPFTLTSKAGDGTYQEFLNNEARYTRLIKPFPERAERLFKESEEAAIARFEKYQRMVDLYK